MAKLWDETIEGHRRTLGDAVLDATASLVTERGLGHVTMSRIAERAGIGRATLYKYFADLDAVLDAWHARHVDAHLERLRHARDQRTGKWDRLDAVLEAFCATTRHIPADAISAALHSREHVAAARRHVHELVEDLIAACVGEGTVRDDVAPAELADYCLAAAGAAAHHPAPDAIARLVTVVEAGLRPPPVDERAAREPA